MLWFVSVYNKYFYEYYKCFNSKAEADNFVASLPDLNEYVFVAEDKEAKYYRAYTG